MLEDDQEPLKRENKELKSEAAKLRQENVQLSGNIQRIGMSTHE